MIKKVSILTFSAIFILLLTSCPQPVGEDGGSGEVIDAGPTAVVNGQPHSNSNGYDVGSVSVSFVDQDADSIFYREINWSPDNQEPFQEYTNPINVDINVVSYATVFEVYSRSKGKTSQTNRIVIDSKTIEHVYEVLSDNNVNLANYTRYSSRFEVRAGFGNVVQKNIHELFINGDSMYIVTLSYYDGEGLISPYDFVYNDTLMTKNFVKLGLNDINFSGKLYLHHIGDYPGFSEGPVVLIGDYDGDVFTPSFPISMSHERSGEGGYDPNSAWNDEWDNLTLRENPLNFDMVLFFEEGEIIHYAEVEKARYDDSIYMYRGDDEANAPEKSNSGKNYKNFRKMF